MFFSQPGPRFRISIILILLHSLSHNGAKGNRERRRRPQGWRVFICSLSFYTAILFTYTKNILNILATFGKILTKLRNSVWSLQWNVNVIEIFSRCRLAQSRQKFSFYQFQKPCLWNTDKDLPGSNYTIKKEKISPIKFLQMFIFANTKHNRQGGAQRKENFVWNQFGTVLCCQTVGA